MTFAPGSACSAGERTQWEISLGTRRAIRCSQSRATVYATAYASWFHPVDDEVRLMFDHIWGEYEEHEEWARSRGRDK